MQRTRDLRSPHMAGMQMLRLQHRTERRNVTFYIYIGGATKNKEMIGGLNGALVIFKTFFIKVLGATPRNGIEHQKIYINISKCQELWILYLTSWSYTYTCAKYLRFAAIMKFIIYSPILFVLCVFCSYVYTKRIFLK
jgi:hypothetical protein